MGFELIEVRERFDGRVVEIALGPPPGNIVTERLAGEVASALERFAAETPENRHRKLVLFKGQGEHFSYGASVEEHRAESVGEMLPRFHTLIQRILDCPVPTMAVVSGLCLGGGFELALACALLWASEDARFGVPEIQLGVFPPAASVLLPARSGAAATEMVLSGGKYAAPVLERFGLVHRVSPDLDADVDGFIEKRILPKSAAALRFAHRAVRTAVADHYRANIGKVERLYLDELMSTADAVEGIEAFLEKRAPRWKDE